MAVMNEVVAVCRSVLDILSNIENAKEDWFTASGEYESEAAILRSRLASFEEQLRIHPQLVDSTMIMTLKRAASKLKKVEARFDNLKESANSNHCCSHIRWLYAKVSLTFFPEKLENTLKQVNQDLDNIPNILKEENEVPALIREKQKNRPISTIVLDNNKTYVPIEESQSAVIKAIEGSEPGRPMILLHGGVGKGKSTLARYMCYRYGKFGEKSNVFNHVIVVSCGNSSKSDLATKQYEILEHLSPTSLTEESGSKSEMATTSGENSIGSKSRIADALREFLLGKKILMILDDVSDKDFLYGMWEAAIAGNDDKILITSQRANLCDAFKDDSVLIKMGDPNQEEARKILASLVGFESKQIPPHLLGIADKMINATDKNPLALACLASNFSFNQIKTIKKDWQYAWMELSKLLDSNDTTIVLGQNSETAAPKSLWGAMKLCIDSLDTRDAEGTLYLMYACKLDAVPEAVLYILCAAMKMSHSTFQRSINELSMRELLKPTVDTLTSEMNLGKEQNDKELQESRTWSLQSLVKLYIESHMIGKQEMWAVIGALLGDENFSTEARIKYKPDSETEIVESDEIRVTIALCALYFDRRHTDQLVTRAVTEACNRSNLVDSDDTINDLRRKAIEPLIWLLDKPEEEEEQWMEMDKGRVRKVLLEYICKRQLDSENISYLLKLTACPSAQFATLKAITHMSSIEEAPLLNENTISFLEVVVDLLNLNLEDVHASVQEAASTALCKFCWKASRDKSAILVANMPGILDVLVDSLDIRICKSDVLTENAANALRCLAINGEGYVERILVDKDGILAGIVNVLSQQTKPSLQKAAAGALRNLADSQDHSLGLRIASEEGALLGLVKCMSKPWSENDDCQLQRLAAGALANIAGSNDDALKLRIANEDGALGGLVNCLSMGNLKLQTKASRALASLAASNDDSLKWRIVDEEGALVGLVKGLSRYGNHKLQKRSVRALSRLSTSDDDSLKLRIANQEGVLVGFVNCLSESHPELQTKAAQALANLAGSNDDSLKLKIANEGGVVVGLLNCLSIGNPELQAEAARALTNLTGSNADFLTLPMPLSREL